MSRVTKTHQVACHLPSSGPTDPHLLAGVFFISSQPSKYSLGMDAPS